MRYPPSVLEEIRARLPVSEVVGKRVRLKKAGREWKGLSPFNAEKSPSFFVNDQKGFYHCFSSGKHGDIFDFLMETEGLSFPETVERLAAEAGVPLPKVSAESVREEKRRAGLHEVMEMAALFFMQELSGRRGTKAREYVERRGLDARVIERFRIGYAPSDRFALRDHLAGKGVPSEAMIEAGLLVTGDDIAVPYDRFRDRVMFPICDIRGRVVAFGGRALSADVPAKYLNSPDTPLFHKGTMLYNAHLARKAAHEKSAVIAVEGYMDVIALARMGIHHAVAPLGTALTEDQLAALWRMADEPILCFDGDKAGRRAAFRALDTALPNLPIGKSLRFAILPEGRDPDDIARDGGGAGAMNAVLDAALPLVDVLWARETEAGDLETPEHRAAFERRLRQAVRSIKDETLQRYYRDEIDARLSAQFSGARRRRDDEGRRSGYGAGPRGGGRFAGKEPQGVLIQKGYRPSSSLQLKFSAVQAEDDVNAAHSREALIVSICVAHPQFAVDHAEQLAALKLVNPEARSVLKALMNYVSECDAPEAHLLRAALNRAGLKEAVDSLAGRVVPSLWRIINEFADPVRVGDTLMDAMSLHRGPYTLNELKAAERAFAEDGSEASFARLCDIRTQLSSIKGAEVDREDV